MLTRVFKTKDCVEFHVSIDSEAKTKKNKKNNHFLSQLTCIISCFTSLLGESREIGVICLGILGDAPVLWS